MSLENAARVAGWVEARLDAIRPSSFVLTFFGGEPLLNLPVMYFLAERLWASSQARRVAMLINVITNGLLLTPEVVDRLEPFGLNGVKITLDGDRDTHNRMRPLRGGQGTFDKIIANIRQIAGQVRDRDRRQLRRDRRWTPTRRCSTSSPSRSSRGTSSKVVVQAGDPRREAAQTGADAARERRAEVHRADAGQPSGKPLNGTCMTSAGTARVERLRHLPLHGRADVVPAGRNEEARVPDRSTACTWGRARSTASTPTPSARTARSTPAPASPATRSMSTGHIDGTSDVTRAAAARKFDQLAAWKACHDCAFIPVCAGGCTVASHSELGDMNAPELPQAKLRSRRRVDGPRRRHQHQRRTGELRPTAFTPIVRQPSPKETPHEDHHRQEGRNQEVRPRPRAPGSSRTWPRSRSRFRR